MKIYPGISLSKEALYMIENMSQDFAHKNKEKVLNQKFQDYPKIYASCELAKILDMPLTETYNENGELDGIKIIHKTNEAPKPKNSKKDYSDEVIKLGMLLTKHGKQLARAHGFLNFDLDLEAVMHQTVKAGNAKGKDFKDFLDERAALRKEDKYGKKYNPMSHKIRNNGYEGMIWSTIRPDNIVYFKEDIAKAEGKQKAKTEPQKLNNVDRARLSYKATTGFQISNFKNGTVEENYQKNKKMVRNFFERQNKLDKFKKPDGKFLNNTADIRSELKDIRLKEKYEAEMQRMSDVFVKIDTMDISAEKKDRMISKYVEMNIKKHCGILIMGSDQKTIGGQPNLKD